MTTLQEIKEQLTGIKADCNFEGWDGEGATPPTEAALEKAEQYALSEIDKGFSLVDISPLRSGGFDVELWETIADKEVHVLIEISPAGTIGGVYASVKDKK